MKKLIYLVMSIAMALFAADASAQYIPVTASSCIVDGSGSTITSGTLIIVGTDSNDNPVVYRAGTTFITTTAPITKIITSGSVSSFQLADPANSSPLNVSYRFVVQDNTTKKLTVYKGVNITPNDTLVSGSFTTFNICKMNPGAGVSTFGGFTTPSLVSGDWTVTRDLIVGRNETLGGKTSSSYVGTTDATFTAGPINTTLSAGFINSLTQTNQFAHGFADESNVALTPAAGGYASFSAAPAFTLATNTNHYNGLQFFPTISGSNTLTSLIGVESAPIINTTSAVTELDDFYVQDFSGTGNAITHRGIFISPLTKATNNHGITDEAALNEFWGVTTFGVAATVPPSVIVTGNSSCATGNAAAQLHVAGASAPTEQLRLGFDNTALVGCIQAEIAGTSFNPLSVQPNGGDILLGTATDCGKELCVTGQVSATGQITSTLASGTAPMVVTSTTPVAHLTTVPTAYDHTGTQITAYHLVEDSCILGTSCAVTLAGSSIYTSSTSYTCTCQDETAIASCKVAQTSGSAFTITGTGTDTIRYHCGGN